MSAALSHTYTHIHTQTHTLLFRVQNPASRGNNEMSALKRLSGDNRQASTSPPSLRCRIRRLRSKGAAGPRLPNCRSQGCHSNGDWRAIHSSAVSRAGRRGAVNSMGVLKVRNGSFQQTLRAKSSQNACLAHSSQTVTLSLCPLDNRPACSP